ncbi:rCG60705, partial [Rattus norvegicus]
MTVKQSQPRTKMP